MSEGRAWGVGSVVEGFGVFGAPRFSVQRSQNAYFKGFWDLWTENRGAPKTPTTIQPPILGPLIIRNQWEFLLGRSRFSRKVYRIWGGLGRFGVSKRVRQHTLSGPKRDTPRYPAIPFRDGITEGASHPFLHVFIWYRARYRPSTGSHRMSSVHARARGIAPNSRVR